MTLRATALLALLLATACGDAPAPAEAPAPEAPVAPEPAPAPAPAEPDPTAYQPATGKVFFTAPADGATVTSPVKVQFGVDGVVVMAAGALAVNTGHHHVIVDGAAEPEGQVVPADATHIHYGKGQTEAELTLAPGKHTLTLQFADGLHRSYGPALSQTITVTVE